MKSNLWLEHYPKEISNDFDFPKYNIAKFLIDAAHQHPNKTALHFLGKKTSYQELLQKAYQFAHVLKELGLKKGERVAIMLPNCPQVVAAYYGTLLVGGTVVMTSPLYKENEMKHQFNDSHTRFVVTLDLLSKRVQKVRPETNVEKVLITSMKHALPFPKNKLYPIKAKKDGFDLTVNYDSHTFSLEKLLLKASFAPIYEEVDIEKDLALLQYTGGTTGVSKGVMLSHRNILANAQQTTNWCYKLKKGEETYVGVLPCFHVFGLTILLNHAIQQCSTILLFPKFDPLEVLKAINKHKATTFPGAPTMYNAIIHHPKVQQYDLSSIKVCISGSAALPESVQEKFEALTGGKLIEGYGLSEASPITHANLFWEYRKSGTIGIPFPATKSKVVDSETGEELPVGSIGELVIKGPQVMQGYWNLQEETNDVLKDGWLYTGDMATMDDEGFFAIVDRKKDMIISGGLNVYPREVEEVLYKHPKVNEAAVIGVPDDHWGEIVKAYIVPDESVTSNELKDWCRDQLANYKVPKQFEMREDLPKSLVGKVLRRELREEEKIEKKDEDKVFIKA
ncbi:long-chain-fatty-acid--CoA ligase [Longirhabdus pacifica]|uniref:long-chain-fatty-acid--CoA ligase n=1 Tax=Longirhabdus pacifica TaxID=2305227 RepID=UPI00197D5252|nr:long-chain fatty acid--CoA ligase [Longirhabdus pacifica]